MAYTYAKLLEQKDVFTEKKVSTPTVNVRKATMPFFYCFWDTNMAEVSSCKNALFKTQETFNRILW